MAGNERDEEKDVHHDTARNLSDGTKDGAKKAGKLAGKGINKATKKAQKAAKQAAKKFAKKAALQAVKLAAKAIAAIFKIILKLILLLWPYILGALALWFVFWLVSGWFVDEEYESKAEQDNYQTESSTQENDVILNPETGRYEVQNRSNGNKLYKMFYGYMAQKGYWKVVVDENGDPTTDLMRGDDEEAQDIVDRYNREKEFFMNSDLLYLLDIELNATYSNDFFFPEQFIQPVYHDDEYNLKDLTDDQYDLVVKSTKYDDDGKPTDEKVEGVWDYGFGSILQYQEFKEDREKRAELTHTYEWDFENHKKVPVSLEPGNGKTITEKVEGYPKQTHLITKVTNSIGTITNNVKVDWKKTNEKWTKTETIEIDAEKEEKYMETVHTTNSNGEPLYWEYNPDKKLPDDVEENNQIIEETDWPVTHEEERTRWVPTTIEVEETYKGDVWEKIPQYDGEPNTDGIVGDEYLFDYLTNYEAYIPDVVMESFNVEERTGKEIEGLEEIWQQQEAVENAEGAYDAAPGTGSDSSIDLSGEITGSQASYNNAMRYIEVFETYGKRYGVDPYLLVAKAAQESSGRHEEVKNPNAGYGIMQIEAPGRVMTGVTALNHETGKEEHMPIDGPSSIDSIEDNIRAGAMVMATKLKNWKYNIPVALQAYNYGDGGMGAVLDLYADSIGSTRDAVVENTADTGWTAFREEVHLNPTKYFKWGSGTFGDPEYLEHVLQYYANPNGGTPFGIDKEGTKFSMDGSIQVGASIVGNGTSTNKNWFMSLIDSISGHWDELFDDSPTDALQNKEDYVWTHHKNAMGENQFKEFMTLYRTYIEGKEYSEIDGEWTLDDWKEKYKALFEDPRIEGTVDEATLEEYEALLKLFPDGYTLPAEKISKISSPYNGSLVELAVGKNVSIQSMIDGEVTAAKVKEGVVEVTQDNGVKVKYTGLKGVSVEKGDKISQGDKVGESNTDLGVSFENNKGNNVDPSPIFIVMGDGSQSYNYQKVLALVESAEGLPYKMVGDANDISRGYFDCSGLMQWAFREAGISLPRTANEQYNSVLKISELEAKPGDLIFFEGTYNSSRPITHVGLYIGNGQFWNAQSSGVKIAKLHGGYWDQFPYHFGRIK